MYKVTHHVEDYFMPMEFGKNNFGSHKVDCNKIICVFFTEEGKPRWELFTCDQIMEMVGFVLPRNKNKTYIRMKFQLYLIRAVNWLCEEHALNIVQIKISEKRRVCYGFTKELQDQADNIDRKIERRNIQIDRTKNRKVISNQKSLKLIKNKEDRSIEHKKVV
jgi:hypothetical protein